MKHKIEMTLKDFKGTSVARVALCQSNAIIVVNGSVNKDKLSSHKGSTARLLVHGGRFSDFVCR